MKTLKRYSFFVATLIAIFTITIINHKLGTEALKNIGFSLKEMLLIIPPIFILIGLFDEWVPKETMIIHMGEKSGIRGMLLAFGLGSFAAGPLYAAFPVAGVLMRKGTSFTNVIIFIGAWSTTKIPMFLFEYSALGSIFAITRLLIDIPVIVIIAFVLKQITNNREIEEIYKNSENL